jgi:hypothetical protein
MKPQEIDALTIRLKETLCDLTLELEEAANNYNEVLMDYRRVKKGEESWRRLLASRHLLESPQIAKAPAGGTPISVNEFTPLTVFTGST